MHEPLERQRIAYHYLADDVTKFVFYGGAAGGGKSWLGCEWLQQCGFKLPGSRWFIGRNNLKDTRESVLITWDKVAKAHNFTVYKTNDNGIKFKNGSEIVFLDLTFYPFKDPLFERFGSKEFTGGWIEEGGEINFRAFEVLKSRIGRHNNDLYGVLPKMLVTLNPKKNWVYKEVYKPWKEKRLSTDTAFVQAFAKDNRFLPKSYIESLQSIKDSAMRERLLKGNWEYDDDPTAMLNYDAILDSFQNDHVLPDTSKRYMTVDVAMYGSDKFRCAVWHGFVMVDLFTMPKSGGKEVIDSINELRIKHQIPPSNVVYDADGVGAFVGGKGGFLPGAKPFNNGGSPMPEKDKTGKKIEKPNYENLKTQCAYHFADRVNDGGYWFKAVTSEADKQEAIEELEQLKTLDADKDGKLRIRRKEDIKEDIKRSPDFLDICLEREYFELLPAPHQRRIIGSGDYYK